jgi:bifunctional non-homologous end joining protein LigD
MISPCLPMLATAGEPFDSKEHVFEVKWDGIRALAGVSASRWQLWGRGLAGYTERYPELEVLRQLPAGTMVDGELIVWRHDRADLAALLRRHQLTDPLRIEQARRHTPIQYVLFDLLAHGGRCLLAEPLQQRRALLAELLHKVEEPLMAFSEGVIGPGQDFFAQVVARGQEGIMAKQLASRYQPGQRSSTWRKIKPVQSLACVIIGHTEVRGHLHSLLLATVRQGTLCYAGQVQRGLTRPVQAQLQGQLARRRRCQPAVACSQRAVWVEPEVYCQVHCFGWTADRLRYPVFQRLLDPADASPLSRSST